MDYEIQYKRQLSFLQRSCVAFDQGHSDEALRIAVALRVLLHDTNRSTSLLTLMGTKSKIHILSTMKAEIPKAEPGFVVLKATSIPTMLTTHGVKPMLGSSDRKEFLPVDQWWNEIIMIQESSFSRKDVVMAAANQDGGAHVDHTPDTKTQQLKSGIGSLTRITASGITQRTELTNHHFPMLRQMAYEFLQSPEVLSL